MFPVATATVRNICPQRGDQFLIGAAIGAKKMPRTQSANFIQRLAPIFRPNLVIYLCLTIL
jgi:hypothetical protein